MCIYYNSLSFFCKKRKMLKVRKPAIATSRAHIEKYSKAHILDLPA
jgi:hypothetical protein